MKQNCLWTLLFFIYFIFLRFSRRFPCFTINIKWNGHQKMILRTGVFKFFQKVIIFDIYFQFSETFYWFVKHSIDSTFSNMFYIFIVACIYYCNMFTKERQFRQVPTLKSVILEKSQVYGFVEIVAKNRSSFRHYCIVAYWRMVYPILFLFFYSN